MERRTSTYRGVGWSMNTSVSSRLLYTVCSNPGQGASSDSTGRPTRSVRVRPSHRTSAPLTIATRFAASSTSTASWRFWSTDSCAMGTTVSSPWRRRPQVSPMAVMEKAMGAGS